ncbi:MAG: hypothetical protein HY676_02655 [Chloroflexi bacterium]|nr:hypothetical protein [Chloroflexota bacterium]
MRLDMGTFQVQAAEFGKKTQLANGTLVINQEELRSLIREDDSFLDVGIDIARHGESVRIIHVTDVVEPRYKVEGPGCTFPGFLGLPVTVGEGRTHRLAGVGVVTTSEPVPGERLHAREAIIEMSGPASQYTPFGNLINVTLALKPNLELFPKEEAQPDALGVNAPRAQEYAYASTKAGFKAASYLAQATRDLRPQGVETLELAPCSPSLLKVALLYQASRPFYYGALVSFVAGTLMHPNESFDGALAKAFSGISASYRHATYLEQNNQIALDFCRRHGKDVNFVGIILYGGATPSVAEKERVSSSASKLARVMGVQAAILNEHSASNGSQDAMLTLQKCEQAGIKTVLIHFDVGSGLDDPGMVFFVPEADAIALSGSRDRPVTLPPVEKVIGGTHLIEEGWNASGELQTTVKHLYSATNSLGMTRAMTYMR